MIASSSASAASGDAAASSAAAAASVAIPTFHCPSHIQLHTYTESRTMRKLSIQRIQSGITSASAFSSSSTHLPSPQLNCPSNSSSSVRLLGLLRSTPAPLVQMRTSHGMMKVPVVTFQLCDDSGSIVVECPLSLLFAHLNLESKQEWMRRSRDNQQQKEEQNADSNSILNEPFKSFVLGLLPQPSSVVEVCGTVDNACKPQDSTVSHLPTPRVLVATAIRWIHTPTQQRSQQLLQAQSAEREVLGREHYFRTTPLPSSHPPKSVHSPKKYSAMSTSSRPPLPANVAAGHTPQSNVTKYHTPNASDNKRTQMSPHTPAPHVNGAASSAAAASPSLPLPLPFSLSQSSQPISLFDDFASSQEERAHFAMADQAAQQFIAAAVTQTQNQQLPTIRQKQQQQPVAHHHQPSTSTLRQSVPLTKATHPPLHPPTGSPIGLNRSAALASAMPSPASSVVSNKTSFNAPRSFASSTAKAVAAAAATAAAKSSNSYSFSPSGPESDSGFGASSSGFQTGSGKSVAMSAAAMERAAKLQRQWEAEEEAERAKVPDAGSEPTPSSGISGRGNLSLTADHSPERATDIPPADFVLGFATGGGKRVEVSDEARKRAEKMMEAIEAECDENQNHTMQEDNNRIAKQASSKPVASDLAFRAPSAKPFRPPASVRPSVEATKPRPLTNSSVTSANANGIRTVAAAPSARVSKLDLLDLQIAQMEDAGDAMELDENLALQLKAPADSTAAAQTKQSLINDDSSQFTKASTGVSHAAPAAALITSPPPATNGFLSGAGKSLALSDAAQERARKLQQQWEKEEEQVECKTASVSSPAAAVSISHAQASIPLLDFRSASRRCRVVKLQRKKSGEVIQDCDVYIGREENRGGWNLARSKWCNPFQTVAEFESYLIGRADLMASLPELQGRTLGCWCKVTPASPCHGDVLVKLVNALEKQNSSSPLPPVTTHALNGMDQMTNSNRQPHSSTGFQFQSAVNKPVTKSAADARLSKFQLELMKEMEMDERSDIIDFGSSSLSQTATFSSGFASAAKASTDSLILPSSSLSGEKRKLSQIPEENTQELLNAGTPSLAGSNASNKSVSPSPVNSSAASLPSLATPLALAPRIVPPTTVQTISSSTFSVDSTSSPPIKRTRYEPNTITTANQSQPSVSTPIAAPPPTPIPIASFDAVSPATPPRDSSAALAAMSGTPASSEKLSNSQIRIPATPSLETPSHSLETEFDAAAASQHQQEPVGKDTNPTEEANQPSSCLPTDSYLPPSFFLTPPLSNLASEITTFASQL